MELSCSETDWCAARTVTKINVVDDFQAQCVGESVEDVAMVVGAITVKDDSETVPTASPLQLNKHIIYIEAGASLPPSTPYTL